MSAALAHEIRLFFIALQFLTRVPMPRRLGFESTWLQQCERQFPLVGTCVGAWAAAVTWAALQLLPPAVAVGLGMAATVWLTGGLHEDGLADTCDGLGGSVDRDRALAIMKDSRIGAYGALGLLLTLGLKAATLVALVQVVPATALAALVWSHAVSRAAPVLLMRWLPYAGDTALAKAPSLASRLPARDAWCAVMSTAMIGVGLVVASAFFAPRWSAATGWAVLCSAVAVAVVTLIFAIRLHRRLGGQTGDTLGAAQQLAELATLLGWLGAMGMSATSS